MKGKFKNILVRVFKILLNYIIFFLLFTGFISITEFFIINLKGGNTKIIEIYCKNSTSWQIILIFLILFISLNIILYIYEEDGKIQDSHKELVEHLKNLNNIDDKKNQVQFFLEYNLLTDEEAEEIIN